MDTHEWPCRIVSARRKKRLVKTHRDKQLIKLNKRRNELWDRRRLLPPIPLEQPYQRGWKRFFVLRDDLKRSNTACFYEDLLKKINTIQYHQDRSFKYKKRRKSRSGYKTRPQNLREFYPFEWNGGKLNLTDGERACFNYVETYDIKHRLWNVRYVFNEPWRYVLKVAPHIVTHKTPVDSELESEMAFIDNHIDKYYLQPRIDRLTRGKSYAWNKLWVKQAKHVNRIIKNIPGNSPKEAYLGLDI